MKKLFLFIAFCSIGSATIINVPEDYSTIQSGINASIDGDTVLVQPGTYSENIFLGKSIAVGSLTLTTGDTSYISQTVIDGNQSGSVVRITSGSDSTTQLTGFTITNGTGFDTGYFIKGGGIYIVSSDPKLSHLKIINNEASAVGDVGYAVGGGIYSDSSNIVLNNIVVQNNAARKHESDELGSQAVGGGIFIRYGSIILENSKIMNNIAESEGGGIYAEYNDSVKKNYQF
tara:strand:- start:1010 stop:1702 length:693 start_codon:yes stop_codon:yes gene_type:complete